MGTRHHAKRHIGDNFDCPEQQWQRIRSAEAIHDWSGQAAGSHAATRSDARERVALRQATIDTTQGGSSYVTCKRRAQCPADFTERDAT